MPERKLSKIVLVTLFFIFFAGGFLLGRESKLCTICQPKDIDFSLFWQVYRELGKKFVDPSKINKEKILYGAISGMVNSLGDPYTVFFTPKESKAFMEDVRGVFQGVGIEIAIKKGKLTVVAPLEGTPAKKAGLRAGDIISKIDGKPTSNISIDKAVELIRGPKGTKVTLTISREGWKKEKDIAIKRGVIKVPSIKLEFKKDNIAYLRIYQFSDNTFSDFQKAMFKILESKDQRIILDLRDNPGGYLEFAEKIADDFLKKGETVVIEESRGGERKSYKAPGDGHLLGYKIVVLVNKGTASGAEILAGALQDNKRAILVGEKTFGKGLVQEPERLRKGALLKITIAKWLTPKGHFINKEGISPDIKVKMTEKDYEEGKDLQLEKAIEMVKKL